jgi:hypothetical protein
LRCCYDCDGDAGTGGELVEVSVLLVGSEVVCVEVLVVSWGLLQSLAFSIKVALLIDRDMAKEVAMTQIISHTMLEKMNGFLHELLGL